MSVTYQIVINSDLPKEYFDSIKARDEALNQARKRYEDLVDFINLNQASDFDQMQVSTEFYTNLERRFGLKYNNFELHLFTRYGNNIVIQMDEDSTPIKVPILTEKCHEVILTRIKDILLDFDIHKFGIVIDYKFKTENGQTFKDFNEMILSFKKSEAGV